MRVGPPNHILLRAPRSLGPVLRIHPAQNSTANALYCFNWCTGYSKPIIQYIDPKWGMLVNNWVCDLCAVSWHHIITLGLEPIAPLHWKSPSGQEDRKLSALLAVWCSSSQIGDLWLRPFRGNTALQQGVALSFLFLFYLLKRECATCPFLLHNKVFQVITEVEIVSGGRYKVDLVSVIFKVFKCRFPQESEEILPV